MTVQWGILSTAHINRRIIPAITNSKRGSLLGIASRELIKARQYAAEWQIPKVYGSYEEMLADEDIDVVYVPLPNHLHAEWIIKSLESGKHVLCEKPICLTLEEFDSIIKASVNSNLCVMEGLMYLHHPQTLLWKSILDSGMLGDIRSMRSCFSFNFERGSENYRWNPDEGGGALWDVGVYPVSFFQYLNGAAAVGGFVSMKVEEEIDISTSALLEYNNGCTGQFFVSFRSAFSTDTVIHGSDAQLYISHPYSNIEMCHAYIRKGNDIEQLEVPKQYLFDGEIENMHDVILEKKQPVVSLDTSRDVLETILKLRIGKF